MKKLFLFLWLMPTVSMAQNIISGHYFYWPSHITPDDTLAATLHITDTSVSVDYLSYESQRTSRSWLHHKVGNSKMTSAFFYSTKNINGRLSWKNPQNYTSIFQNTVRDVKPDNIKLAIVQLSNNDKMYVVINTTENDGPIAYVQITKKGEMEINHSNWRMFHFDRQYIE